MHRFRQVLFAAGMTLLLFVIVYVPTFILVGSLRLPLGQMVPAVMLLSFAIACGLIALHARRWQRGWNAFGFCLPRMRFLLYAFAWSIPCAAIVALCVNQAGEPGPLAGLKIAPWLAMIYFGLIAPIQEETIFRGLLQTTLARRLSDPGGRGELCASLGVAVLFAVIHLAVGPLTALGALVLGVLAGEWRRRSGSLLPAIVCHALFNLAGILL
ncbi:MAG TPA: type II CAAX endopeptidase family protein [Rhodanobacter sp.]|nr:type II CAAX endopeptidase family protein [Rhodanobacter sp.]